LRIKEQETRLNLHENNDDDDNDDDDKYPKIYAIFTYFSIYVPIYD